MTTISRKNIGWHVNGAHVMHITINNTHLKKEYWLDNKMHINISLSVVISRKNIGWHDKMHMCISLSVAIPRKNIGWF